MSMTIKVHTTEKMNNAETIVKDEPVKNEDASAAKVFEQRKKDVLDRLESLRGIVDKFSPSEEEINEDTISDMDYILDSLDNVIKDTKDATGLS